MSGCNNPERRASPRAAFVYGLALTLIVACCYAATTGALLAAMDASKLHAKLGDAWYNALLGGGGVWRVLLILWAGLLLSTCVAGLLALRRYWRRPLVLSSMLLVALLAVSGSVWASLALDPVIDKLIAPLFDVSTDYASGYSDEKFRSIRVGFDEEAVLRILGQPLRRWQWESCIMAYYSIGISGSSYWQRIIIYDLQGRVTEVTGGLYVS